MKRTRSWISATLALAAVAVVVPSNLAAQGEYNVKCKSENWQYTRCSLRTPGYVTMVKQESKSPCTQGRTWDFDRREIWVDDGCAAEFRVHPSDSEHLTGGEAAAAAGIVLGAAILGALANNKDHSYDDHYQDPNYQGSRHSSFVPQWMIGTFRGYNPQYGTNVTLTINPDGRAMARTDDGRPIPGWINNQELHVGDAIFDVNQTREGFVTHPVGDHHNVLRYQRVGGSSGHSGAHSGSGSGLRVDASGPMPCGFGSPVYNQTCQFRVTRHGNSAATIYIDLPNGYTRTLEFRQGEFSSDGGRTRTGRSGDFWTVDVNGQEFFRFADAVITGG